MQSYLLSGQDSEVERLQLQARVWQAEAEVMLNEIDVRPGSRCIDLGCGAMGILGPLSRRVGPNGKVLGIDLDANQLKAARDYTEKSGLENVDLKARDAYATNLPNASFDLVHARFLFAPEGRDEKLLREMMRLCAPGGIIVIQEPDASSWNCHPVHPAWTELKEIVLQAFKRGGGDFDAGMRMLAMLKEAGLEAVQTRAAVRVLHDRHPYMRSLVQFARSLRQRIVEFGLAGESHLHALLAECERICAHPETLVTTFTLHQVWGWLPKPRTGSSSLIGAGVRSQTANV